MSIHFRCARCQSTFPMGSQLRENPNRCPICKAEALTAMVAPPPGEAVPAPRHTVVAAAPRKDRTTVKTVPVKTSPEKTAATPSRVASVQKPASMIDWRVVAATSFGVAVLTTGLMVWLATRGPRASERVAPEPPVSVAAAEETPESKIAEPTKPEAPVVKIEVANPPAPEPTPEEIKAAQKRAAALALDLEEASAKPAKRTPLAFKHRVKRSDEELRRQLVLAKEVDITVITAASRKALAEAPKNRKIRPEEMPDFSGLPMRMGVDCQIGDDYAKSLQALSRKLRTAMAAATPKDGIDTRPDVRTLRGYFDNDDELWSQPEAVPTLTQMLMAENRPARLLLVDRLARIAGSRATEALAQRAIFDLSVDVREAAVEALRDRKIEDIRPLLLKGLRYPWAPAADHAADALIALADRASVPALVQLLRAPDPSAPFADPENGLMLREVVRINHLSNCAMCHAQSTVAQDLVRGRIPTPGVPLPPPIQYYDNGGGIFVRADVTYLQQDFSVPQPVAKPGQWPTHQRYDYVIRLRPLTSTEKAARRILAREDEFRDAGAAPQPKPAAGYEQRDAILFALRELTGKDAGMASENWERLVHEHETSLR